MMKKKLKLQKKKKH